MRSAGQPVNQVVDAELVGLVRRVEGIEALRRTTPSTPGRRCRSWRRPSAASTDRCPRRCRSSSDGCRYIGWTMASMFWIRKNESKIAMGLIQPDQAPVRQHPPHLGLEMRPLLRRRRSPRTPRIRPSRGRRETPRLPRSVRFQKPGSHMNAIGYLNSSGSSSVRIRLPSVRMSTIGQLAHDQRQVLLGARVVVVPGGAEPPRREPEPGIPAQAHEGELAVVVHIGAMDALAGPIVLGGHRRDRREADGGGDAHPTRHA